MDYAHKNIRLYRKHCFLLLQLIARTTKTILTQQDLYPSSSRCVYWFDSALLISQQCDKLLLIYILNYVKRNIESYFISDIRNYTELNTQFLAPLKKPANLWP